MAIRYPRVLLEGEGGLCEPMRVVLDVSSGLLREAELGHYGALTRRGTQTVLGWGDLDGECAVYERQGCGSYLIPLETEKRLLADVAA